MMKELQIARSLRRPQCPLFIAASVDGAAAGDHEYDESLAASAPWPTLAGLR
jgi:hypothetical protein